jgi:AIR synthase-related protein
MPDTAPPPIQLRELEDRLRSSPGLTQKATIKAAYKSVGDSVKLPEIFGSGTVRLGDDCAALQVADGWLLFAMEGLIERFVNDAPWFAGYSAVMVNASDIYAMGGRAMAVTNALWLGSEAKAKEIWAGMLAASQAYGVPIVGGHTAHGSKRTNLAVSVLGRANRLLTTFDAKPGDRLLVAVDLRGELFDDYPFWNASTHAPAHQLRDDLEILPKLAEEGLCCAARDISMGGIVGTLIMLSENSKVGALIDLEAIPQPDQLPLDLWLTCFPSFGFILSVPESSAEKVRNRFVARDLHCEAVGTVNSEGVLDFQLGSEQGRFWKF